MKTPMTCTPVTKSTKAMIEAINKMGATTLTKTMDKIVAYYVQNNPIVVEPQQPEAPETPAVEA